MLPVPIGSSRNSNFEADVLESTYSRALLPMIFVISIVESIKTARSALKVEKQVGSVYLLVEFVSDIKTSERCISAHRAREQLK